MADFDELSDKDLLNLYGSFIVELKKRNIIRTKNIVGDLGEYFAKEYYNNTPNLPTLLLTDKSTKNIDAISNKGERYSIKTTSSKSTGSFWGIEDKNSEKVFEHLIIVRLNDSYELKQILELDWDTFVNHLSYDSRMKGACKVSITKKLIDESKIIYEAEDIK